MGSSNRSDRLVGQPHPRIRSRRAMALLVVMVLTMLIALGAYRYSFTMQAQYRVTRLYEEQAQARLAALSGLEVAALILENPLDQREAAGGLESNSALFQHIAVGDDSQNLAAASSPTENSSSQWHVSLLAPAAGDAAAGGGGLYGSAVTSTVTSTVTTTAESIGGSLSDGDDGQTLVGLRFGLENQSAKLHIPTLLEWEKQLPGHARATLMRLPQAESGPVDDWLRRHGISSSGGAAGESRLMDRMQSNTSSADQGESRDWFRMQWLGGDLNQNYRLDTLELMIAESLRSEVRGGSGTSTQLASDAGLDSSAPVAWQQFLSWHNGERNESLSGRPRTYLNQDSLQELHRQLLAIWPAEWANFVIALRQYGPGQVIGATSPSAGSSSGSSTNSASSASSIPALGQDMAAGSWTPDFSKPAKYRLSSVLDLVDVRLSVPNDNADSSDASQSAGTGSSSGSASQGASAAKNRQLRSPFSSEPTGGGDYNERLLDESTVEMAASRVGRVDLRQAPLEVLAGVPGIDQQLAQQIVAGRDMAEGSSVAGPSGSPISIAWLLSQGLVDLARLKQLEPYLTCRSDVYRTQAIGYRDSLTPVYRCTAVIDARQLPAQIIDHQVWHAWDRGFPIERFAPDVQ